MKSLKYLKRKEFNIPVQITRPKQLIQDLDVKKPQSLSKLDTDNMLEMLEGKEVTQMPKILEKKRF